MASNSIRKDDDVLEVFCSLSNPFYDKSNCMESKGKPEKKAKSKKPRIERVLESESILKPDTKSKHETKPKSKPKQITEPIPRVSSVPLPVPEPVPVSMPVVDNPKPEAKTQPIVTQPVIDKKHQNNSKPIKETTRRQADDPCESLPEKRVKRNCRGRSSNPLQFVGEPVKVLNPVALKIGLSRNRRPRHSLHSYLTPNTAG